MSAEIPIQKASPVHTAERRSAKRRSILARLVARLHAWAESGWSGTATATYELMQSSVMPGPSGLVFVPLSVSDPRRVFRLMLWALLGAVAGGTIAYLIGVYAFDTVGMGVLDLLGVRQQTVNRSQALFERRGWMIVLLSTVSPLSTKLTCIAAGAFGVPAPQFALALVAGRAARFAFVAFLCRYAGARLLDRMARKGLARADWVPKA